jgi:hypothetical protein
MIAVNKGQLCLGVIFLFAGTIEYLAGRARESVYFLEKLKGLLPAFTIAPHPYGWLGAFAPDFFHPLGFSLISMAFFKGRSSRASLCLLWFFIDSLFEIAQKYGRALAPQVPQWFSHVPFLENLASYLQNGTFDTYDLLAIALGSITAFGIGELLSRKGE